MKIAEICTDSYGSVCVGHEYFIILPTLRERDKVKICYKSLYFSKFKNIIPIILFS